MNYWLFKSEPNCFSISDLKNVGTEPWDGVRNYQARNFMMNECKKGDQIIFYHSSCKIPAAVGVAEVSKESYPDHTAWDPKSEHPDPASTKDKPRWFMIDVSYISTFKNEVPLSFMKEIPELSEMKLLQKGNRLSLFPITKKEFETVLNLGA